MHPKTKKYIEKKRLKELAGLKNEYSPKVKEILQSLDDVISKLSISTNKSKENIQEDENSDEFWEEDIKYLNNRIKNVSSFLIKKYKGDYEIWNDWIVKQGYQLFDSSLPEDEVDMLFSEIDDRIDQLEKLYETKF